MKNINVFLGRFYKESALFLPLLAALFINAFIWLLIIWRLPASAAWIPLYYNVYFGIGWIGQWINVIYYPGLSLLILIINLIISGLIYDRQRQLGLALAWAGLGVQVFVLITVLSLIINYFS
ncbi:MAG: hypothetical protein NTZ18_03895 [Candidatus Komeilibacteria bacterium]|nr:hypothetical protein [Candidatus Komeilibacteria bacterium]